MTTVSGELIRAVLEVRDHRHNETHAALVAIYQSLVCELLSAGLVDPGRLAERLGSVGEGISPEIHGEAARGLVSHIESWLLSIERPPGLPHPPRWRPPAMPASGPEVERTGS